MPSATAVLTGVGVALLIGAFFFVNLVPIPWSNSSSNTHNQCNPNCPTPPPTPTTTPANVSLTISKTLVAIKPGGSAQVAYQVTTNQPLNLTADLTKFSANFSTPVSSEGTTAGVLTITAPSSILGGVYPFDVEAVSGNAILAQQSMVLEVTNSSTSQTSTTTTTSSSSTTTQTTTSSNYYFGDVQSYSLSLTRKWIGSDGNVLSGAKLFMEAGGGRGGYASPSQAQGMQLEYVLNITSVPSPNAPSSAQYFVSFESLASSSSVSPVSGSTIATGSGWGLHSFSYEVPLTGGSVVIYLNATNVLDGVINAAAAPQGLPQVWSTAAAQSTVAGYGIIPIELSVTVIGGNTQIFNVKGPYWDYELVPVQSTTTSVATTTTTTTTSSGNVCAAQFITGGGGAPCIQRYNTISPIVYGGPTVYNGQACTILSNGRGEGSCRESLIPVNNLAVRQLSIFGFNTPGMSGWEITTSDLILIVAVISFGFDAYFAIEDHK